MHVNNKIRIIINISEQCLTCCQDNDVNEHNISCFSEQNWDDL